MATRPPPPDAPMLFEPPSAWISPKPVTLVASMRTLPPAPAASLFSPFARILPSTRTVPAAMRTTPPPERHGRQFAPLYHPAPPGSFGSNRDPYVAFTGVVYMPP